MERPSYGLIAVASFVYGLITGAALRRHGTLRMLGLATASLFGIVTARQSNVVSPLQRLVALAASVAGSAAGYMAAAWYSAADDS